MRFDEVWGGLVGFDEVWGGLVGFDEVYYSKCLRYMMTRVVFTFGRRAPDRLGQPFSRRSYH